MSSYFRAISIDFDGTLTVDGPPSHAVLAAIDRVRAPSAACGACRS
jgi:hydroxymethylpyrimidine pyrophosphatase-like HAD family hydrolase